jgi:exopolyphosphatase/guanosine-5'-triphosphate,3'-diphosphate pyrophosphatase
MGLTTLYRSRAPVRLGTEVFAGGPIGAASTAQLVAAFCQMAERLQAFRVARYTAVATSALRDAANGPAVVDAIAQQSGIAVQIISGVQEAQLMRQALLRALQRYGIPPPPKAALLMDLGGGSLELMRADGSQASSLPMGTVRVLAQHPALLLPISPERLRVLADGFIAQLRHHATDLMPAPMALGTGGNVEAMAQWVPATPTRVLPLGPPTLSVSGLLPAACALGPMTLAARAKAYGLHAARADLLLPALLIVHAVGQVYGLEAVRVPGAGIRDALLYRLSQQLPFQGRKG